MAKKKAKKRKARSRSKPWKIYMTLMQFTPTGMRDVVRAKFTGKD